MTRQSRLAWVKSHLVWVEPCLALTYLTKSILFTSYLSKHLKAGKTRKISGFPSFPMFSLTWCWLNTPSVKITNYPRAHKIANILGNKKALQQDAHYPLANRICFGGVFKWTSLNRFCDGHPGDLIEGWGCKSGNGYMIRVSQVGTYISCNFY